MELEHWLQADMLRYIRAHEHPVEEQAPVRHEDAGNLLHIDYLGRIEEALAKGRFEEARSTFKQLRQDLTDLPPSHQEERKRYFRMVQTAYKHIYEYVAEQHKEARILQQLKFEANVFDQHERPVDIAELDSLSDAPLPSIEEQMLAKPFEADLPKTKRTVITDRLPAHPQAPPAPPLVKDIAQASVPPPATERPRALMSGSVPWTPPELQLSRPGPRAAGISVPAQSAAPATRSPPAPSPLTAPAPAFPRAPSPAPPSALDWEPLSLELPPRPSARKHSHVSHARRALSEGKHEEAQEHLLRARKDRMTGESLIDDADLGHAEAELGSRLAVQAGPPADSEFFSSAYLQGVHAMAHGDYRKAVELFQKRMQQTPHDRAARIRLRECLEVLNAARA